MANKKNNVMNDKSDTIFTDIDITIVGGGVVGCAVARNMTLMGANVLLVEKSPDILDGASKGNSAILHTGYDAPENSVELECVQDGYNEFLKTYQRMNLPLLKTGALVVAWNSDEESRFPGILDKAKNNGVDDVRLLSRREALAMEPNLSQHILAAIEVPREFVVDPWSVPLAHLTQAVDNGCKTSFDTEVKSGEFDGKRWLLRTNQGIIHTTSVINSAGLYGDILDKNVLGDCDFVIKPRKGDFVVFDKAAARLIRNVILPVPTQRTKGVVIFPTIFGNVAVGPTADEQESRSDASVDEKNLKTLHAKAIEKIPGLKTIPITATYAGIRSATETAQYRIRNVADRNWITLGGIRSTGLTSALGIALRVQKLYLERDVGFKKIPSPAVNAVPNLAEHLPRDWRTPGYDEIVCHCEMTTKREIIAAMNTSVPAGSLDGLKRRTRVTMGRCQGFYCLARLAELTQGKFNESIAVEKSND